MTKYLVFKLNLQPAKLLEYQSERKYLITELIPRMLEHIISLKKLKHKDVFEIVLENNDDKDFKAAYDRLLTNTSELLNYYEEILKHYEENGEIFYSKEFLRLNSKCSSQRRELERKFPVLENALSAFTDDKIDREIGVSFDSKIGTGIVHLRKFNKIKKYIEDVGMQSDNPLNVKAYYRPIDEHILIKLDPENEAASEKEARAYISYFESLFNSNKTVVSKLGKININPIYDSIKLSDESYTEISFSIVYPNGNPSLDRHNILEAAEAKEAQITILGTDERPLKKEAVENIVNVEAKKGYLKSIYSKGKGIIAIIKRTDVL